VCSIGLDPEMFDLPLPNVLTGDCAEPGGPMHPERFAPPPESLELLDRVAHAVARAGRLSSADADAFVLSVHARMAERGYDVLLGCEGRGTLRTYLTVVLARALRDWRDRPYGPARPSAPARGASRARRGLVGVDTRHREAAVADRRES
jgi:hypothetical protein